eukprot:gb/GECG01009694.1/.p1 GENE.gb/GECG01009694.1/~~gb/GECG01009694.1/.p1  ORF type:complete len:588 (+),score=49.31 gb/GECG01009694.1/:1-1764(+)
MSNNSPFGIRMNGNHSTRAGGKAQTTKNGSLTEDDMQESLLCAESSGAADVETAQASSSNGRATQYSRISSIHSDNSLFQPVYGSNTITESAPGGQNSEYHQDMWQNHTDVQGGNGDLDESDFDETSSEYTIGASGAQALLPLPDERKRSESLDSAGHVKSLTTASLRSVTVNIINTVVGGGVLLLPYAMFLDGDVIGPLLILFVAALAERSVNMLLYSAEQTKSLVYSEIGQKVGGKWLCWLVDISILLQNYGLCVSYVVLIGQLLPPVLHDWFGLSQSTESRDIILALLSVLIFFPLCCLRTLDKLRYTSFVALACVFTFVAIVTAFGIRSLVDEDFRPETQDGTDPLVFARGSFIDYLKSMPLIFFSFVAHNNILLLYSELKRRSKPERESKFPSKRKKHLTAVRAALITCATLYILQGLFGYIMFRGEASGNVLMRFNAKKHPFQHEAYKRAFPAFKLIYVLVLTFSFPVMAFGLRRSIHTFFWKGQGEPSVRLRVLQAAGLVTCSAALGIAAGSKVDVVFGLTGSLAASSVMFVLPSLFFILLRHSGSHRDFRGDLALAYFTLAVGLIVCVGSTYASVYKLK